MVMSLTPLSLGAKSLSDYLKLTYIRYKSVLLYSYNEGKIWF